MSRVQSGNGKLKSKRYHIVVYNSDEMSFAYVIEAFQSVLGYESTQAANCAHLIDRNGEYIVKSYSDISHAEAAVDMLYDFGFKADVVDSFQK